MSFRVKLTLDTDLEINFYGCHRYIELITAKLMNGSKQIYNAKMGYNSHYKIIPSLTQIDKEVKLLKKEYTKKSHL